MVVFISKTTIKMMQKKINSVLKNICNSHRHYFDTSLDIFSPSHPISPLFDTTDTGLNKTSLAELRKPLSLAELKKPIRSDKLNGVLIWAAGGPASGKTTLLNNMAYLMKEDYGQNIEQMLVIGDTLMESLNNEVKFSNSFSKPIDKYFNDAIIIDNHCTNDEEIQNVINFAKQNNYTNILIHPWIDYNTFCDRLIKRKKEVDRDYDLSLFWEKHMIFQKKLHQYISVPQKCPFDICLVYDNNFDFVKPLIYAKIINKFYLSDNNFLEELYNGEIIKTGDGFNFLKANRFIPKKDYLSMDLKIILNCLFKDLTKPQNTTNDNSDNFVELNNHIKSLIKS